MNEKRIAENIIEIRNVLTNDDYYNINANNVAMVIASIMEYCALHENNCEECIFNRPIGCCFKPHYTNPIPENWNFKSEV